MPNKYILKNAHKHGLSEDNIYFVYKIFFGTLFSESRLKIINLLRTGEKNVSELIKKLDMNQANVSHNLARLRKCGFVKIRIKKQYRYYSLNSETIKPLMKLIDKHMGEYCIHIFKENKVKKYNEKS